MSADTAPALAAPAFPGQRPPFAVGNTLPLVSGHRSPRVYGELAAQLAAGLTEDRPDLGRYPEAVAAWATAEAQAALIRRQLDAVGPLDAAGEPRGTLLYWLHRAEASAMKHRAALGLDPRAEAALTRDRAATAALASSVDLGALAERGRAALAAREAGPLPDLATLALDAVRGAAAGQPSTSALDPTAPDELARAAAAVEARTTTPTPSTTTTTD